MAFEQKDMTGALFTNDQKGKDNAPQYKGNCLVGGRKLYISAWVKKDRNDKPYMSLSFEPPRDEPNDPAQQGPLDDPRDDLERPF